MIYFTLATIFFYDFVLPRLQNGIIIGADSKTYIEIAQYYGNLKNVDLINLFSLKYNYFGPVILLLATNYDHLLIYVLNSLLFVSSSLVLFRHFEFNRLTFFALMFINPISLLSFTTINKEIIGLCSIILLLSYIKSGRLGLLALAFALAFFTRWQQAIFVPVPLLYLNTARLGRGLTWRTPVFVLVTASAVYPFVSPFLDFTGDTSGANVQAQFQQAGGILPFLN